MLVDQIPQLQAQINQISQALQNPNLPRAVRQQTEMQQHQLQIQLSQAQAVSAALAVATFQQQQVAAAQSVAGAGMGGFGVGVGVGMNGFQQQQQQQQMGGWNQYVGGGAGGQGLGQDSAYQRLPINNRRRNLKRDRPSDFFETTNPDGSKIPRYWE